MCGRARRRCWARGSGGARSRSRARTGGGRLGACGLKSGSGLVVVGPKDARGQGGSNGTGYNVAVAVLSEMWLFSCGAVKKN
jgi:hypothetical protein